MVTLLLLATVVPRALGPDDYGRFSVPLTIVTLGSLAMTLGGPTVLARFVPAAPSDRRVATARALGGRLARGRAVQLVAVAAGAVVVVVAGAVDAIDAAVVVAALALHVAAGLALQVGLGLGRTGAWSARFPLQNAVLVAAALALDGDPLSILLAGVAAASFGLVVVRPVLADRHPPVPVPDGAIRFGVLQAAGAALTQVSHRGGVLLVAWLASSSAETGYAALAIGIALGATYAVLQAFTVTLPSLAVRPDAEHVLTKLCAGMLAVLVPAALVVAARLGDLVDALFGADFADAATAFGPAVALVVLAPVNALAVQVAALRLRPEAALAAGVASAIAFAVVGVATVPAWGASGATSAALAGAAAATITSTRLLRLDWRLAVASLVGAAAVVLVA